MTAIIDIALRALARTRLPGAYRLIHKLRPPAKVGDERFLTQFNGLAYEGSLREHIDREIYYFGAYSRQELNFLAAAAKRTGAKVYYDIGANIGQHSLWMATRVPVVHAFEPSPTARAQFTGNIERNDLKTVTVHPFGLGAQRATANLRLGLPGNAGSRSLLWGEPGDEVQILVGDEVVREQNLPLPDVIKLDVEGYEKHALDGLSETIRKSRPIIILESFPGNENWGFVDEASLHGCLYDDHVLFSLEGRRQPRLVPFVWGAHETACIPAEKVHLFKDMIV